MSEFQDTDGDGHAVNTHASRRHMVGPRHAGREAGPSYLSVPCIAQAHQQTLATGFSPSVPLLAPHLEHGGGGRGSAAASPTPATVAHRGQPCVPLVQGPATATVGNGERTSHPGPTHHPHFTAMENGLRRLPGTHPQPSCLLPAGATQGRVWLLAEMNFGKAAVPRPVSNS